jgi:hypothetical protein
LSIESNDACTGNGFVRVIIRAQECRISGAAMPPPGDVFNVWPLHDQVGVHEGKSAGPGNIPQFEEMLCRNLACMMILQPAPLVQSPGQPTRRLAGRRA